MNTQYTQSSTQDIQLYTTPSPTPCFVGLTLSYEAIDAEGTPRAKFTPPPFSAILDEAQRNLFERDVAQFIQGLHQKYTNQGTPQTTPAHYSRPPVASLSASTSTLTSSRTPSPVNLQPTTTTQFQPIQQPARIQDDARYIQLMDYKSSWHIPGAFQHWQATGTMGDFELPIKKQIEDTNTLYAKLINDYYNGEIATKSIQLFNALNTPYIRLFYTLIRGTNMDETASTSYFFNLGLLPIFDPLIPLSERFTQNVSKHPGFNKDFASILYTCDYFCDCFLDQFNDARIKLDMVEIAHQITLSLLKADDIIGSSFKTRHTDGIRHRIKFSREKEKRILEFKSNHKETIDRLLNDMATAIGANDLVKSTNSTDNTKSSWSWFG